MSRESGPWKSQRGVSLPSPWEGTALRPLSTDDRIGFDFEVHHKNWSPGLTLRKQPNAAQLQLCRASAACVWRKRRLGPQGRTGEARAASMRGVILECVPHSEQVAVCVHAYVCLPAYAYVCMCVRARVYVHVCPSGRGGTCTDIRSNSGGSWQADCPWVLPVSLLYTFARQSQAWSVNAGGAVVQALDGPSVPPGETWRKYCRTALALNGSKTPVPSTQ